MLFFYASFKSAVSGLIGFVVLMFAGFYGADLPTFLLAVLYGILLALGTLVGVVVVRYVRLTILSIFTNGAVVVPVIYGIFFFSEPIKFLQWVGIAFFVAATFLLINDSNKVAKKITFKAFLLLLGVFLANGAVMIVQKYFALKVPSGNVTMFSFLSFASAAVIFFIISFFIKKPAKEEESSSWKKLAVYGIMLAAAVFVIGQLITISARTVSSAVLFPVSSALALLISTVVSVLVFKEKITVKTVLGILLGIAAAVVLNL